MNFKGVIFDLDGTLLNTIDDIAIAVNSALADYNCPPHNLDRYKAIVGSGVENLVEQCLPVDKRTDEIIKNCAEAVRDYYRKNGLARTRPYDGIAELLDRLTALNVKIAVLSNKPHDSTVRQISYFLPRWKFEAVEGAKEGVPIKPDPSEAQRIITLMGFVPQECIFLGDTEVDMQTAIFGGLYPVGVTWGFRTGESLKEAGAAFLIEKPVELLKLFNK